MLQLSSPIVNKQRETENVCRVEAGLAATDGAAHAKCRTNGQARFRESEVQDTMSAMLEATVRLSSLLRVLRCEGRERLLELRGLGAGAVDRILEERKRRGGELGLEQVLAVRGVGPRVLAGAAGDASVESVLKYVLHYRDIVEPVNKKEFEVQDVLSIDIGLSNTSYALLRADLSLKEWCLLSLDLPKPYSPVKYYSKVCECVHAMPSAETYIMEAQSHRTVPPPPSSSTKAQGFLGIGVQLRILEAMFLAGLTHVKERPVYIIQPRMRLGYFGISATRASTRKKASVEIVNDMLSTGLDWSSPLGNKVVVPDGLQEYYKSQVKLDDLSDCLLQALSFLEWSRMASKLV